MGDRSSIEWTDATWNPVTGCWPISDGCDNCYAKRIHDRFGEGPYSQIVYHWDRFNIPRGWKKPRRIFVGSMTDLFQKDVQDGYRVMIEGVIADCPQHTFMMLTKRADNMREYFNGNLPYKNLWLGVTVEGPKTLWRIDALRKIKASVRFISFEPLLADPGKVDLSGISWVIVGGETGSGARDCKYGWVNGLLVQCSRAGVPFFFKGWGTKMMKKSDPYYMKIDGKEWKQSPEGR